MIEATEVYASQDVKNFQEFCAELFSLIEVSKLKKMKKSGEDNEFLDCLKFAWKKLFFLIEKYAKAAEADYSLSLQKKFEDVKYAMVILADEVFIQNFHEFHTWWRDHLLEYEIFGTRVAGEMFYDKVESLLKTKDSFFGDVGYVYLSLLQLGFRGKYFRDADLKKIESHKKDLYAYVYRKDQVISEKDFRYVLSTPLHVVQKNKIHTLPNPKKWLFYLLVSIVVYFAVSYFASYLGASDVLSQLRKIVRI